MPSDFDAFAWTAALLGGQTLTSLLVGSGVPIESARATYLRVKPGAGVLVALDLVHRIDDGERITTPGYLRVHPPQRAAELAKKWHAGRAVPTPLGDGVRILDDGCSVLFVFPNDAQVRGLRFVAQPDKLKRLLGELPAIGGAGFRVRGRASTFTRVRYKPERRLILRGQLALRNDATGADAERAVFVRFFTDTRGERLQRLMLCLRGAGLDSSVPEPLGAVAGGRMFVETEVPGRELFDLAGGAAAAEPVAELLARLHGITGTDLAPLVPASLLGNVDEATATLALLLPELGPRLAELGVRLRAHLPAAPTQASTLHGDCHLHQFLVAHDRLVLVDFERAASGDAAFDLGHLRAHAMSSARAAAAHGAAAGHVDFAERVVDAYRSRRPDSSLAALPFYTACGLLDRALLPYRHIEPDWRATTEFLVEAALAELAQAPAPAVRTWALAAPRGGEFVFHPNTSTRWPGRVEQGTGERTYGVYDLGTGSFVEHEPTADRALPGLRHYAARGEIVAYRVGRRATLRIREPELQFVKLLPPDRLDAVLRRWQLAGAGATAGSYDVPAVVGCEPELGAIRLAPLPGVSLHDVLAAGPLTAAHLEDLAVGLLAFHRAGFAAELDAVSEPRSLAQWCAIVAPFDPGLAQACAGAAETLAAMPLPPAGVGVVHGDLHDRNLFLAAGRVGLLDLDGLRRGDPSEDVGNFAAHFVLRATQHGGDATAGAAAARAWIDAYARGDDAMRRAARIATAGALVRLACVYRFRSRWVALPPRLVDAAIAWQEAATAP